MYKHWFENTNRLKRALIDPGVERLQRVYYKYNNLDVTVQFKPSMLSSISNANK